MEGLNYCLKHETYLKVFLGDGNVPIDNSASERAIRPFCIGKRNWVLINSIKGCMQALWRIASQKAQRRITCGPYMYFKHLLTELLNRMDEKGNIDTSTLDDLMPWAESLPAECYKRR